ncbi:hypothetical protein [Nostoc sp.]|uniref:hypothetical protein n=1 Tax=Nostoc sp. TaxID=1180 RepID=UPI002FFC0948
MTQIVGTLKDSAGNGITGKLIVVLAGSLIDDSTNPDTIYLPQSYTFNVTAGALDITLPQSETSRITYNFQFFKTATDGSLIEPALINFNAMVPNVSPVQFASLTPTGITNDVMDTGALRTARIMATTPALAQSIGGPFPRGSYSPTTTYKFRDLVTYLNRTYISQDLNPITGVVPTNTTSWMNIPVEPNGSLILADGTPYGSTWDGSGKSASQDAVYDQMEDVKSSVALKANLISPIFSGDVIVPNQTLGDASTKAANTNFVAAALSDSNTTINTALALKAPLSSPTLTGTPIAPTAATSTNTTQIATTAYVKSNLTSYATLASPTFTGTPAVPTASVSNNTTQAASTAFVKNSTATFATTISSASIQGNNTNINTLSLTSSLGSSSYRFAFIKVKFSTVGFGKSNAIVTATLRDNAGTTIETSTGSISNTSYLDNNTIYLTKIYNSTFTGNYAFSLYVQVNAATTTDVYTLSNPTVEVLFFA